MAPVVSAALGALGPLLVKLAGLLAGEYGRLKGVGREIQSLQSELTSMHAALKEYTELEDPSGQVKAWISLVRELAYDTEDVFDKFILQLGKGGHRRGFKGFLRKIALPLKKLGARHGIADQINDLKARIKQVKELKDSYKLNDPPASTTPHATLDPRLHALFAEEAHLVGVDGPRDDLAKWLVEENNSFENCKVLSIVGFGGLGKTTLANAVYRKIQGQFHCCAFVSVSQKPDIKKIIKDVISQVSSQDGSIKDMIEWDEKTSIAKLRELLKDKMYLVIIDDVWSAQVWNTIKCAFPENNCSSRIIATTRIIDVAKSCCPSIDDRMYEMESLDDLHSRRLFFKRIFGSDDQCPGMLKEVSSEILQKCGGLPLAIISISSLLANRSATKQEWEKVKRSIGSALENNQNLEGMNSILCLSYNDLPPNLKTCLLYLSVFPEDYEINRERLVRRWIAEGFISEERGQSREEVAESYFYELINKSMLQPVDIEYDGKVRACQVHDMMLELIISKSAEDNFTTVVGGGQTSFANRQGFIRRLSIQYIDQELASALANEDLSHVRSLTVTPSCGIKHLPSLVQFEALRVLDFEGCEGLDDYDMKGIDKFHQLKYFSARRTKLTRLPSRIVVLDNLETLNLGTTRVAQLPAGIAQLTKLRHLIGGDWIPNGIGDMRKLQLMSGFVIGSSRTDAVEDLGNLTSLEELNVYLLTEPYYSREVPLEDRRCEEAFLSALCKLGTCKLRSLEIESDGYPLDFLDSWSPPPSSLQMFTVWGKGNWFKSFPRWITPALTNLVHLNISLKELTDDDLLTLRKLPSLLYLRLELEKFVTVQGISSPSLKVFDLSCDSGVYFAFVEGSMPRLEILDISFSVSMGRTHGFYLGIEHLPCLKQVDIWLMKDGATTSETKAAAAAIRNEAGAHPNHPAVAVWGDPSEEDSEESGGSDGGKSNEDGSTDED